jgi:glycosyltransferase involved in cell wall biosynthesis
MFSNKHISIIGTRGIPASHGGFEVFAEHLSLFLSKQGWHVTVYCQEENESVLSTEIWKGIHLIKIPVKQSGSLGSIIFDWKSTLLAAKDKHLILLLGYNTAIFSAWFRLKRTKFLINMDGIEWRRGKWGLLLKTWFYLNERLGCYFGNHLIADHPKIKEHLATRVSKEKITMIPYGANLVDNANIEIIESLGLKEKQYAIIIARPEPENSILEIVKAYSAKKRGMPLVILGEYSDAHAYHKKIKLAASDEIIFLGAIYDAEKVEALRFYSRLYIHGHTVGGTNPSLVEALGTGSPVLAHDNIFNHWVAGKSARYFNNEEHCKNILDDILNDETILLEMSKASKQRFQEEFVWEQVLRKYEKLLANWTSGVSVALESK